MFESYIVDKNLNNKKLQICPHAGSNYRPPVYKTGALPLSYRGSHVKAINYNFKFI